MNPIAFSEVLEITISLCSFLSGKLMDASPSELLCSCAEEWLSDCALSRILALAYLTGGEHDRKRECCPILYMSAEIFSLDENQADLELLNLIVKLPTQTFRLHQLVF